MSGQKNRNDDFGTLEELDAAEPAELELEVPEPEAAFTTGAAIAGNLRDLVSSYAIVPIPVAILDESLLFLYKNASFERMMETFEGDGKQTLFGAIGRFLDADTARSLIANIRNPERGFSWTGTIRLRSRKTSSVISKTTIVPFRPESSANARPHAWVAFMDDVTEEQNGFLHGLFLSLLEASKLKDNDTGRHIERVNLYAERLATALHGKAAWPEIDIDFIENIGFLAAMHDVGKIGTPDDILNKKGPLDEFEWNIMKEHTINGAFILSSYPDPMAKQIAQSHHEWWDGTGYPYKIMGNMIPLPARIVSIADVYDALRMRRSYKEPFDHKRASLLIVADAGTHFDPALVEVFKTIDADFDRIYEVNADAS